MEFVHTDCGHLVGCDDPAFDLRAELDRRTQMCFELDLATAIETGEFVRTSSSSLHFIIQDAIAAVAREYPNPTAETIEAARAAYQEHLEWKADIRAQSDAIVRCEKSGKRIANDNRWHVCPSDCTR
jgi:hypothetical protein